MPACRQPFFGLKLAKEHVLNALNAYGRQFCRGGSLPTEPILKDQHIPQLILPISTASEMFSPFLPDGRHVEEAVTAKTIGTQQVVSPFAQRAAEPTINRHAKTHLRALNQCPRHVLIEHLPQDPLADSVANFEVQWKSPGKFHHAMI